MERRKKKKCKGTNRDYNYYIISENLQENKIIRFTNFFSDFKSNLIRISFLFSKKNHHVTLQESVYSGQENTPIM